jgi:hypothetical protein
MVEFAVPPTPETLLGASCDFELKVLRETDLSEFSTAEAGEFAESKSPVGKRSR